jgi:hypothetical protein
MTLRETKQRIKADPAHWQVYLMDFVDEFRRTREAQMIAEPFNGNDDRFDALLAATAEQLCYELGLPVPEWIKQVGACREAWFVSGIENLKAIALAESPAPFRLRKVFVLENFLQRV